MYAKTTVTLALAFLASSAVAQTNATAAYIATLDIGTKTTWCNAEFNTCNTLCGNPIANSCDNPTLNYVCTCANKSAPGLQYYVQTIPYFLCEAVYQQCIAANLQNATGQSVCIATEKADCGQLDPTTGETSSSVPTDSSSAAGSTPSATGANPAASSSGSSTASSSASSSASATQSPVSSSSSAGAAATMLALGRELGSGIIAAGIAVAVML